MEFLLFFFLLGSLAIETLGNPSSETLVASQLSIQLNSSLHDLRRISLQDCELYHHPPKPFCSVQTSGESSKVPVFVIQWKLSDDSVKIDGFCYHAINITTACDYRSLIYYLEYIVSSNTTNWPWIERPTREELASKVSKGFLDDRPPSICSWGYRVESTAMRKRVLRCEVHTTSSGVVTDEMFHKCDLQSAEFCDNQSGTIRFVPASVIKSFPSCPVRVANVDVGIMESLGGSSARSATLTSIVTKRLFHWAGTSISEPPVCVDSRLAIAIYRDDGGYMVSMETLDKKQFSPALLFSELYNSVAKPTAVLTEESLKTHYNDYMKAIVNKLPTSMRPKRQTVMALSPFQQLFSFMMFSQTVKRPSRTRVQRDLTALSESFSFSVSDLQLSFLRSEIQHDFSKITKWLNDKTQLFFMEICNMKLQDWTQKTLMHSPPETLAEFNTGDPNTMIVREKDKIYQCIPSILAPNVTYSIPLPAIWESGKIRILDSKNKTLWLYPHTGVISDQLFLTPTDRPHDSFLLPFKKGCSVDLKTTKSYCPHGDHLQTLDVTTFLHTLGPMYNPAELANLMKPATKTIYMTPSVVEGDSDTVTDVSMSLGWISDLFEPLTKLWKFLSPNTWTLIYILILGFVVMKLMIIWISRGCRLLCKSLTPSLEIPVESDKKEEEMTRVHYSPLAPSHLSDFQYRV